jgi:hypothetical protein
VQFLFIIDPHPSLSSFQDKRQNSTSSKQSFAAKKSKATKSLALLINQVYQFPFSMSMVKY